MFEKWHQNFILISSRARSLKSEDDKIKFIKSGLGWISDIQEVCRSIWNEFDYDLMWWSIAFFLILVHLGLMFNQLNW